MYVTFGIRTATQSPKITPAATKYLHFSRSLSFVSAANSIMTAAVIRRYPR